MDILYCILMSFLIIADGFVVKGPTGPLVVPLGGSVVLPCYVDTALPMEHLEVEWRRSDTDTPVHLYQDGGSRPEVQQQDYHDRAHFFTDQIQHGNFSLLLSNVRPEDKGFYTCKVFGELDSGETVVEIKDIERLILSGSSRSISVYAGDDVTLNCSVDSHITPEEIEEVSWKKLDKNEDGDFLVLLYQNNQTLLESSDEQYMDRVEFFTDQIPKGNFSLRLKSVRTEDKGVYMCQVFAGDVSANTTVVLELGFSDLHIMVLILCIAASGSALLLCCLIYCKSKKTETSRTVWTLQVSLAFCPNICMFLAFIVWGATEGFLNETVPCCALYILRPVMLLWALPFINYLQDDIKSWIRFSRIGREFAVLTIVVYSVLFAYAWKKSAPYKTVVSRVFSGSFEGIILLLCLFIFSGGFGSKAKKMLHYSLLCLAPVQSYFMISSFGTSSEAHHIALIVVAVVQNLPLWFLQRLHARRSVHTRRWMFAVVLLDVGLALFVHLIILEKEEGFFGWTCVILFLHVLRMMAFFDSVFVAEHAGEQTQQTEMGQQGTNLLSLCNVFMYMFGAVGVILLNSVALTAELEQKSKHGERALEDLRFIVFPSECVFVLYWFLFTFWKPRKPESVNNGGNVRQRHRRNHPNAAEIHELQNLSSLIHRNNERN
ncbi:uncharacterized protein LOC127653192 isoform X3 [Xyrauchen texanus]|uniref:uncharacterized protein LOC127653192 isoform X2 n=1 Tax=Xyrauchen texanus TaxID=154827 RepID=UPI0022421A1F|nr:uncharacterized protein LOC127653192 isoform X2 [Xyrauchen texanus]XP_051995738.1 uncharacterized protein LOC127653192 isoform X3 [Xyrauchen texanus]